MTVHVVGLPHLDPLRSNEWCAYSQKIRRLGGMLAAAGHDAVVYAGPAAEGEWAEHVVVVTDDDRTRWFGDRDWTVEVFDRWEPDAPWWQTMNARAGVAVRDRWRPGDILGVIAGRCQQALVDAVPGALVAEWGIGYEGVLDGSHKAFESAAWQHWVYGRNQISDGRFYDTVIPNAFDPADLEYSSEPGRYLLYMGRLITRKGIEVAVETARRTGLPLVTAGQGDPAAFGIERHEHAGVVTGKRKAELLAGARAILVPTLYVEPFGGVAVEAMLSGTPAITTGWGAFAETVTEGVAGFRCATLAEFCAAAVDAGGLDRAAVHASVERFTTGPVAARYDAWLRRLGTLYDTGWYEDAPPLPAAAAV